MAKHGKKSILLVEDEAIIALAKKRELEKYGYTVSHVLSGEEAVSAVIHGPVSFDLVLMDIDLGRGIDGTEAARQILEYRDIPVVFLSSHTEPEIVEKTEEITSYGYVVKNSGPVVLDASIKMALKLFDAKTERRLVEEENKRFKTISDRAVYGSAIADLEGNFIYINSFFAHIHGYEPEEILGHDLSIFHTPAQMEEVSRIIAHMKQKGYFEATRIWHVHRDGTEFPMLMSGLTVKDEQDVPKYIAVSAIDLTGHHHVEQQYQTLFSKMLDGFALHEIIVDGDGRPIDYRFLDVNPAFGNLTGLDMEKIRGKSVFEVLPGTEQYWIEIYGKVAMTGEAISFTEYAGELGKYFKVTSFCPAPGQFACIFHDITELKRAEEDLRLKSELLEMTQELTHVGGWEWDAEKGKMIWTEETWRIHGMNPKNMQGSEINLVEQSLSCYDPSDRPIILAAFTRCVEEGIPYDLEFPLNRVNGERIRIRTMARAIIQDGHIVKAIGNIIEITDRSEKGSA